MKEKDRQSSHYKVPRKHGEILLAPSGQVLRKGIAQNHRMLENSDCVIAGQSLGQLRAQCRQSILPAAREFHDKVGLPPAKESQAEFILATGHQSGFFHCGILAKYLLAHELSESLPAVTVNLIVDSDVQKDMALKVSDFSEESSGKEVQVKEIFPCRLEDQVVMETQKPLTRQEAENFSRDLLQAAGRGTIREKAERLAHLWNDSWKDGMRPDELVSVVCHRLADQMGLTWWELPVSRMCENTVFQTYTLDWIFNAARVRRCYNESLRQISDRNGPVSELGGDGRKTGDEIPLWFVQADGKRRRVFVRQEADRTVLNNGDIDLADMDLSEGPDFLKQELSRRGLRLRPRAIGLTVFARLFWSDLFIHGAGGGSYERVADGFIQRYYGINPPLYAQASATMKLYPPARQDENIKQQYRRRLYHPQRDMDKSNTAGDPAVESLLEQRARAIAQSNALKNTHGDKDKRREVFERIHQMNERLRQITQPGRPEEWERLCDRDFFFGFFQEQELRQLRQEMTRALSS